MHDLPHLALAVLICLVLAGMALIFLGSLVSVLRSRLSLGMKLVWFVLIFAVPLIGCVLWFLVGRRQPSSPVGYGG
jgi:heme/copper-type cytochrome/quinol oxidase subunit 2